MRFTSALLVLAGCSDQAVGKFNSAPDAQITSPADGATVLAGTPVTLRGAASDPNHAAAELTARWFVDDAEACAAAVPAADGTTSCEVIAPSGTSMDVRLEVTDPEGAAAAANIRLQVTPNAAPVATIASPETGGIYYSDQLVTFRGTLADAEDAPAALTAWWEDGATRLDAVEATPTSAGEVLGYALLAEGPHALELHVQDTAGNEGIATVLIDVGPPNSTPDCAITAPATLGASESGERVDFLATVSDGDIGSNLLSVTWDSDKDGVLGTSSPDSAGSVAFSTSSLSVNTHRVTMTVADEVGATCASAITWTVGTAPAITLETPILDEVVNEGDNLAFSAIVSDNEDVASDLWVSWESDRDGLIYEGPPDSTGVAQFFDSGLSFGDHALTVTVTDSAGLYATALGAFTVNGAPSAPTVSISPASPYTGDDLRVSIDTAASDPDGDPLTYTYAWSVDGVPSAASTSSTLPASATSNGETWAVSVTATDGLATSAPAVASTLIANTPPVAAVSLTPGSPTRSSTLTCSAASTDADADTVTYGFSWTVAGAAVAASTTASDTSTLASAFAAGDVVTCVVLADDGEGGTDSASASVTIGNTAPVVSSVTLSPGAVYTNDTLTATPVSSDADGDSLTLTYDWYVDGALAQSGATATLSGVTRFSRGQAVYVTVTADDGTTTASANSSSVTVSNTAPTAPVVAITPVDAADGDDLTCSVTTASYDADGDALTYSFDWDVDGVAYGGAADGGTSSMVDGGDVESNDIWSCSATPTDGDAWGANTETATEIGCWVGTFDGAYNEMEVADAADLSPGTGPFTVDAWFEPASSSAPLCLISKRGPAVTAKGLALVVGGGPSTSVLCHLHSGTSELLASSTMDVTVGDWHHLAVMRDAAQSVSCFLDGVSVSTGVFSENITSGTRLFVGACNYEAESGSSAVRFEGDIAEVRWSNTAEYSASGFVPEFPLPVTTETSALWSFERSTTTVVYDYATGTHDGAFDGSVAYTTCPRP